MVFRIQGYVAIIPVLVNCEGRSMLRPYIKNARSMPGQRHAINPKRSAVRAGRSSAASTGMPRLRRRTVLPSRPFPYYRSRPPAPAPNPISIKTWRRPGVCGTQRGKSPRRLGWGRLRRHRSATSYRPLGRRSSSARALSTMNGACCLPRIARDVSPGPGTHVGVNQRRSAWPKPRGRPTPPPAGESPRA